LPIPKEYKGIPGRIPDLSKEIKGCPFKERCTYRKDLCDNKPEFKEVTPGRWVACHFPR
ncbi:MAG TPA: dipeptide/oligopeptide/nickel ABC transporter ATP-binding protein, partial [Petrotoga sp.]|nr:dipeptide/oligopeptide/nickel ABC transporter ATP-binding protein [Petrotoga sp.]